MNLNKPLLSLKDCYKLRTKPLTIVPDKKKKKKDQYISHDI